MSKFKIGDRVRMKDSYRDWLISNIPAGNSVNGKFKPGDESELLALFCSREFGDTLDGTIDFLGTDGGPDDPAPFYTKYTNQYGAYMGYVDGKDLIKLKKVKRCRNCGKKP